MPYDVEAVSDPTAFQLLVQPLIDENPVDYSVLASNLHPFASGAKSSTGQSWYAVRSGGASRTLVAAAMRIPPHPLHIPSDDPAVGTALAEFAIEHGVVLDAVGGMAGAATAFADSYASVRNLSVSTAMRLLSYDLPGNPVSPAGVRGAAVVAAAADLHRCDTWMSQFMAEADPDAGAYRSLDLEIAEGRLLQWEVDDQPVSQAFVSRPGAGVARISGVYTPAANRGHGYASALVAALSARVQRAGNRCMLFTDATNLTTNHIYQQIGYRRRADSVTLRFGPPVEVS